MKRRITKKSERKRHILAWHQSGESKKQYCARVSIKYATFMTWLSQGLLEQESEASLGGFVELSSCAELPPRTSADMEIIFPNGIRLYGKGCIDAHLLKSLYVI